MDWVTCGGMVTVVGRGGGGGVSFGGDVITDPALDDEVWEVVSMAMSSLVGADIAGVSSISLDVVGVAVGTCKVEPLNNGTDHLGCPLLEAKKDRH